MYVTGMIEIKRNYKKIIGQLIHFALDWATLRDGPEGEANRNAFGARVPPVTQIYASRGGRGRMVK